MGGRGSRVAYRTLTRPVDQGGLAAPDFRYYFWASRLNLLSYWFDEPSQSRYSELVWGILPGITPYTLLMLQSAQLQLDNRAMHSLLKTWDKIQTHTGWRDRYIPNAPIWSNAILPAEVRSAPPPGIGHGASVRQWGTCSHRTGSLVFNNCRLGGD